MKRKAYILAALGGCLLGYTAYPYVTLYRLTGALRHGDIAMLTAGVDWDQVREGMKEDICDEIAGDQPVTVQVASHDSTPPVDARPDDLPPFGASFVTGMATNIVDETVTPEHLGGMLQALRTAQPDAAPQGAKLDWAFFTSPTTFQAAFRLPGEGPGDAPVRLEMALTRGAWKVTRAWMPAALLEKAQVHAG